jgi:hypothetical protein
MINNSNYPKVLIGCPVASEKMYILPEWGAFLKSITYPNAEFMVVDNSQTEAESRQVLSIFERMRDEEGLVIHTARVEKERDESLSMCIAKCVNLIREKAFEINAEFFLSLECDIFPPVNVIDVLMSHMVPVASGIYFSGLGPDSDFVMQKLEPKNGIYVTDHARMPEVLPRIGNGIFTVFNPGIGCSLIHVDVLREVPFQGDSNPHNPNYPDTIFARDCFQKRIPIFVDGSFIIRHENRDWASILRNKKSA